MTRAAVGATVSAPIPGRCYDSGPLRMIGGRIADDIPRLVSGDRSDGGAESRTEDPEWDTTRPSVRG